MTWLSISNALLGGLGLFLVGMWLMTDGLRLAAGNALRALLRKWTTTRYRGLVTGFSITALVQSSSAVTVATIGFANAGLLNLEQAVWVIFGSNVGTTMTGWIVALVGFKINVDSFALPLVGIGMIIRLTGAKSRRAALGQALVGFGLFFLGISVLKEAFENLGSGVVLPGVEEFGIGTVFFYVLLGFVLTTLMQSSSVAIVITLSAAEGGLIPLSAAAAAVIGANLGTTTTALLSVLGATPVAKRVAASHVMFNLITALIAIVILAPMLALIAFVQQVLHLSTAPAASLALFHTVFNVLGVILMIPLAGRLTAYLSGRFASREEAAARLEYLDNTVLEVPALAVVALSKELNRFNVMVMDTVSSFVSLEQADSERLNRDRENIEKLIGHIGEYVAKISRTNLPESIAGYMPEVMHYLQQNSTIVDNLHDAALLSGQIELDAMDEELLNGKNEFNRTVGRMVSGIKSDLYAATEDAAAAAAAADLDELERNYDHFRLAMLKSGAQGRIEMRNLDAQLQQASLIRRGIKQLLKANRRLHAVTAGLNPGPPGKGADLPPPSKG